MTIIDPDIRKAETLPSRFYTDSKTFDSLLSSFANHWHFAAHRSQLCGVNPIDNPLREPMLLTREGDELHCVSNVCTHRGMLVCSEPSESRRLQCPYHGRTFGLNGVPQHAEFSEVENFPTSDHLHISLSEWKGYCSTVFQQRILMFHRSSRFSIRMA